MKRNTILLLTTILITMGGLTNLFAQYEMALREFDDFKNRTLVVVLEEPTAKLQKNLSPEEFEIYKQEIAEYNEYIRWAVDSYYKIGNNVVYKTTAEAEGIRKRAEKNFALLRYTKFSENYGGKLGFQLVQKNRFAREQTRLSGALSKTSMYTALEIWFAETGDMGYPVLRQYMPTPFPTKADVTFGIKQMIALLQRRQNGLNIGDDEKAMRVDAKLLQSKTLLISQRDLESADAGDVLNKSYRLKAEIVSQDKLEEAIINSDERYACVMLIPVMNSQTEEFQFQFMAIDAASGKTLSVSKARDVEKNGLTVEPAAVSAFKSLKKASTESKIPPFRLDNLKDFEKSAQ